LTATLATLPTVKHVDDFSSDNLEITTGIDTIEDINDFTTEDSLELATFNEVFETATLVTFPTEKHVDDFSNENIQCKCPRRRKICENGEKPSIRKPRLQCQDGSKPRCPNRFCPIATIEEITTETDVEININDEPTEKHIDHFVVIHMNTETVDPETKVTDEPLKEATTKIDFSKETHIDPFVELTTIRTDKGRVFPVLFEVDTERNVSNTVQCNQDQVLSCKAVKLDTVLLQSLTPGSVVMLLNDTDFTMELVSPPSVSNLPSISYSFILSTGGEATLTTRQGGGLAIQPSVYASIHTYTKWIYNVESCGTNCTVMYRRDANYFNQFEDK